MNFDRLGGWSEYLMGRLRSVTDKHSDFLENIIPGSGISIYENAEGGITIELSYDESLRQSYTSFFRVVDASTLTDCKVGVTSGYATYSDSGNCGVVKVNGIRVYTPVNVATLTSDGEYHVWIHSWVDALSDGHSSIIFGAVDDDAAPANPNGGILYGSQLAGRVVVVDGRISSITQDYLRGGEHIEWLFAPCDREEIAP